MEDEEQVILPIVVFTEKKKIESFYIAKYVERHSQPKDRRFLNILDYLKESSMQFLKIYAQELELEALHVM